MAILTRQDREKWNEFGTRLLADLGGEVPGNCAHDYARSTAILADMGFDVQGSLDAAKQFHGDCDCTILLNIDAPSRTCGVYNP